MEQAAGTEQNTLAQGKAGLASVDAAVPQSDDHVWRQGYADHGVRVLALPRPIVVDYHD